MSSAQGAVRLHQGDYEDASSKAPATRLQLCEAIRAAEGASRIHLVDLDGASQRPCAARSPRTPGRRQPRPPRACRPRAGSASLEDAFALLDAGADRVVVGTAAFPDPRPWAEQLGDKLVVALDIRDGMVRTVGWTEASGLTRERAVELCLDAGVARVLCTAIDRDETAFPGPGSRPGRGGRRLGPRRSRRRRRPLTGRRGPARRCGRRGGRGRTGDRGVSSR